MAKFDLKGANAIVTGGSRGIGPYIAEALAGRGARVALVARSKPELQANAQRLSQSGAEVVAFPADVTSAQERRELIPAVERRLGRSTCSSTTPAAISSASSTISRKTRSGACWS